jgi:hypothetical protein
MQHDQVELPGQIRKGCTVEPDSRHTPLLKGILACQVLVANLSQASKQMSRAASDIENPLLRARVDGP